MIDRDEPGEPSGHPDGELIVIGSFPDAAQAQLARNLLDEAGIDSTLDGEAMGTMALGTALGGVRLLVREADADRACEIVDRVMGIDDSDVPDEDDEFEESGEEAEVPSRGQAVRIAWKASIIGLFLCPPALHFYSLGVLLANGCLWPRGERVDRRAIAALLIDLAMIALAVALAWRM